MQFKEHTNCYVYTGCKKAACRQVTIGILDMIHQYNYIFSPVIIIIHIVGFSVRRNIKMCPVTFMIKNR